MRIANFVVRKVCHSAQKNSHCCYRLRYLEQLYIYQSEVAFIPFSIDYNEKCFCNRSDVEFGDVNVSTLQSADDIFQYKSAGGLVVDN